MTGEVKEFIQTKESYTRLGSGILSGRVHPVTIGATPTAGAFIQVGSVITGAGSGAYAMFPLNFSNTDYTLIVTPYSGPLGAASVAFQSGIQDVGSANIIGEASSRYKWVAIGI